MLPAEATGQRRHLRRPTGPLALLAVSAALVAAGCGDDEGDDGAATTPSASSTDITITLDADGPGGEKAQTESVVCEGSGSSHPACAAAEEIPPDAAAAIPPDTACTEIYGGPDVLKVEGVLNGQTIDATFTRANGCEIERFDRFVPMLQELYPDYEPGAAIGA